MNNYDPSGQRTISELMVTLAVQASLRSLAISYYGNLLKFGVKGAICIKCFIRPGNEIQSDALLTLAGETNFPMEAQNSYEQGRALSLEGYRLLGKAALEVYSSTAISQLTRVKVGIERTTTSIYSVLASHSSILVTPRFLMLERASFGAVVVVSERDRYLLDLAKLKRVYDGLSASWNLLEAITADPNDGRDIGEVCFKYWERWAKSIPWRTILPKP